VSAVADKLREARALITKGKPYEQRGEVKCVCMIAALADAGAGDLRSEAREFLRKAVSPSNRYTDIATWNDRPGRTQAEVLAAFDRAIELAEAGL
jgi:endonuclease YncB( thermonuclease family)